ncbi:hypothetical protein [Streptomyces sp. NPDC095613]|uniref:RNA polymerase sigma factor n=1 Tax=Streptomyces sp. NPDC095613 TaxID=3155540 RepID=UPI00331CD909
MSRSPETSPHNPGAHRVFCRAPRPAAKRPPARYERFERYEPYLDGLFTYCLSVLRDHDAATEVLGEVLSVAERQHGRCPSGAGERKVWLYALARWACLRRLTRRRAGRGGVSRGGTNRGGAHASGRTPEPAAGAPEAGAGAPEAGVSPETAERRRRELALLAWPEAAGTTPEQREALELAVRHRLGPGDIAAVLSMEPTAARDLLASATCEVDRTRAALAVADTGDCPAVERLTGGRRALLSSALRRELVRHVDDCPRCRRAAERAEAAGPWPGSYVAQAHEGPDRDVNAARDLGIARDVNAARAVARSAAATGLPLVRAERTATYTAMAHVPRARSAAPRFGRNGFPLDPKDRAARRERIRSRAVTTTVVATVVAAPVLALWAAHRGAPVPGESHGGLSVSAASGGPPVLSEGPPHGRSEHYENAGNAGHVLDRPGFGPGRAPELSVEVVNDGTHSAHPAHPSRSSHPSFGRIATEAWSTGDTTVITLKAAGGEPVSWTAGTTAPWLALNRHYGTLTPGDTTAVRAAVDHRREPSGPWSARIALYPAGSLVKIYGYGSKPPAVARPRPSHPGHTGHPGRSGRPDPVEPPGHGR